MGLHKIGHMTPEDISTAGSEQLGARRVELLRKTGKKSEKERALVDMALRRLEAIRTEVADASIFGAVLEAAAANADDGGATAPADKFFDGFIDGRTTRAASYLETKGKARAASESKTLTISERLQLARREQDVNVRFRKRRLILTAKELGMIHDADPKVAMETVHGPDLTPASPKKVKQPKMARFQNRQQQTYRRKC